MKTSDFDAPCPVQECLNKNKCHIWTHSTCGEKLKLNDEGMIRCPKCETQEQFVDWEFKCGDHDYKECSSQGVAHCLAGMAQVALNREEQQYIARTTGAIMGSIIERQKKEGDLVKKDVEQLQKEFQMEQTIVQHVQVNLQQNQISHMKNLNK